MSNELETRVIQIVADVLGVAPDLLSMDSSYETVSNWDSVNVLNLMMALEAEFGVQISVDDAVRLISMRSMIELLREKGAN